MNWYPAPQKIEFGLDMVIAHIALDRDHTLTLYCEKEMIPVVEDLLKATLPYGQV